MSDKPSVSTRDSYYDNLRGLLMFVVVFCHGLENIRTSAAWISDLHEVFLSFCMPLFVVLTGFFAKSMAKAGSPKRLRIANIALMYVIAQSVKMLLVGSTSFLIPKYGNWFLLALVCWYGMLPFIAKLKPVAVFLFSVAAAMLIGMEQDSVGVFSVSRLVCLFPFFMAGFYLNKDHIAKLKTPKIRFWGMCVLVVCIILCVTVWTDAVPRGVLHSNKTYSQMNLTFLSGCTFRLLWYGMATFMSFGVMSIIPSKKNIATVLGTRTMPIFVVHTCLFYYLIKETSFFQTLCEIPNDFVRVAIVLVLSIVMMVVCGNKYIAQAFDRIMGYDFHHFMSKEVKQKYVK